MSPLITLKKLILGETWLLPLGAAAVVLVAGLALKPLLGETWEHAGGFLVLAGVAAILVLSVARGARPRSAAAPEDRPQAGTGAGSSL
jgi:hypothetical protein